MFRNFNILENQTAGGEAHPAHIPVLGPGDAGSLGRNIGKAQTLVTLGRIVGAQQGQMAATLVGSFLNAGDISFLAVNNPFVAFLDRSGLNVGEVGTAARFGGSDAEEPFTLGHSGQNFLLDFFAAMQG